MVNNTKGNFRLTEIVYRVNLKKREKQNKTKQKQCGCIEHYLNKYKENK